MVNYRYQTGPGDVGSYQISGIPYATSSLTVPALGTPALAVNFPNVTKFVTIVNSGSAGRIRVGFSALGVTGSAAGGSDYYFTLDNGDSYTGEWRVESIYVLSDSVTTESASVIAGLTGIVTGSIPGNVAGTLNWSGSIGVG